MAVHLRRELDVLKEEILKLGVRVEELLHNAVRALMEGDKDLASQVKHADIEIDDLEVEIEEECLKILALYQPVAVDLRFIVAILKINNDLERIGDLGVNIAKKAIYLAGEPQVALMEDMSEMAATAQKMVRQSLDALIAMDVQAARDVCIFDDEVDEMHKNLIRHVETLIQKDPARTSEYLRIVGISRNLERIADHATNIAEDTIYLTDGSIVRHGREA